MIDPSPVTNCRTFSDPLSPSSVTYFMDGPLHAKGTISPQLSPQLFHSKKFSKLFSKLKTLFFNKSCPHSSSSPYIFLPVSTPNIIHHDSRLTVCMPDSGSPDVYRFCFG